MILCISLTYVYIFAYFFTSVAADQFNCPKLPPITKYADNIYELRPQDIKVVMALGDSVTAGTMSTSVLTAEINNSL